jgi:hypothetical protein
MNHPSRYVSLGIACLLAVAVVGCGSNQASPSASPSPAPAPSPAPSPTPTPSATVYTVSGTVAETEPTTNRFLGGVTLSTGDRSVTTDDAGRFVLADLPAGTYTLRAEKGAYANQTIGFTLPADAGKALTFNLAPDYETVNVERNGSLGPDNGTCEGSSEPCARYDFPAHYAEAVMATLLWSSSDTVFNLELRCNGEPVARQTTREGGDVGRNGERYLFMELNTESREGNMCEIRILHMSGPDQNWILVASHPN